MKFTMDTTLSEILAHPQAKPVIEKYLPGVADNPMLSMAKGMTLNMILSLPQAAQYGLTKEKVQKVLDEINQRIA